MRDPPTPSGPSKPHAPPLLVKVRSVLFQVLFYLNCLLWFVLSLWLLAAPRAWLVAVARAWARSSLFIHRLTTGASVEIRGRENIPGGSLLVAAKHQSAWETIALLALFNDAAFILKRELLALPLFGWYVRKLSFIPIDRSKGDEALRAMQTRARIEVGRGRQVIIFPEGTRQPVGAPPRYRRGVARLYDALGVPCLPVALNSGLAWPPGQPWRYPARIIVEILPTIPPGLAASAFMARLEREIETATARLLANPKERAD